MIRNNSLLKLSLSVAVFLALCGSSMATENDFIRNAAEVSYGDTTREEILETRNRRKRQVKVMVADAKKKLAEYASGERILTEEEKTQLESSVDLFQRKIESMEVELEEWVGRCVARVGNYFFRNFISNFP